MKVLYEQEATELQGYLVNMECEYQNSINSKIIRLSTDQDMKIIKQWLDEIESYEFDSLRMNWHLTENTHREDGIFVYIDSESGEPVGYLWPDFGILEVKPSHRDRGIGRALVDYGLSYLLEAGNAAIAVQCAPESSIPFWEKMGFNFYTEDRAFKIIPKTLTVPGNTKPADVKIQFYSESKMWDKTTAPIEVFSPEAFIDDKGKVYLTERVTICILSSEWHRDPVVSIHVEGDEQYTDKAKRPQASQFGVKYTGSSYSIDVIDLNAVSKG